MSEIYVIVENGFDYNDEYYTQLESCRGTPVKYYTDKALAEEVCKEMNIKARDEANPQEYIEDYSFEESSVEEDDTKMESITFFEVMTVPLGS